MDSCARVENKPVCFCIYAHIYYRYRGGVDSEGRPVMVVVGAHFLLRCLDLERFVMHVVKVIFFKAQAA